MAFSVFVLAGFLLVPAALVVLVVLLVMTSRATPGPLPATAAAARRHAVVTTVLALTVGAIALVVGLRIAALASGLRAGLVTGLVPVLGGLGFLAVHAIGEATWPRPAGELRRASLERRTVRDVSPRLMLRAVVVWTASLAVTLLAFGLVAADTGRAVTVTFAESTSTAGPFPGWFYGLPLFAAAAVVLAGTWGVLRQIATRPAVADAAPRWDLALRRLSAHRVLRGTQAVLGLTLVGVLWFAGTALRSAGSGSTVNGVAQVDALASGTGTGLMVAGGIALLTSLLLALVPGAPASLGAEAPDAPPTAVGPVPSTRPADPAGPPGPAPAGGPAGSSGSAVRGVSA